MIEAMGLKIKGMLKSGGQTDRPPFRNDPGHL
jgi:hypothetical protein